jgi:hypothetical protein
VTLIALLVGAIGVVRIVRAARRLADADLYTALEALGSGVSFPVHLDVLLSLVWGVILLAVWWGLWRLRPWARRAALIVLPAYAAFSLAWLAIFVRADYDRGRLPFAALAALVGVALIALVLNRRRVRRAFAPLADGGFDE